MDSRHRDNAKGWEITSAMYAAVEQEDIDFLRSGGVAQQVHERNALGELSNCEHAIHLQCAAGKETLSLLNLGVERVTGIDIAEGMIASARRKSVALEAAATWICCDVLDAPDSLDASADLVHTGGGALAWLSDLDQWADVVARLLKPGGRLHIYEGHPLDWVWDHGSPEFHFAESSGGYFSREPGRADVWPMPFIQSAGADSTMYEFQHTLGDVVTAVARAGLRVETLQEHPEQFWDRFKSMPQNVLRLLPHSYTLVARRA